MRMNIATHTELAKFTLPLPISLVPSKHAAERAKAKGVLLPDYLKVGGNVVELETEGGRLSKLVLRIRGGSADSIYVVVPLPTKQWLIVTCWTNASDDNHATLNKERMSVT